MVFLIQLFIFLKGFRTALSGMNEKVPTDTLIFPGLVCVEKPTSVFFKVPSYLFFLSPPSPLLPGLSHTLSQFLPLPTTLFLYASQWAHELITDGSVC